MRRRGRDGGRWRGQVVGVVEGRQIRLGLAVCQRQILHAELLLLEKYLLLLLLLLEEHLLLLLLLELELFLLLLLKQLLLLQEQLLLEQVLFAHLLLSLLVPAVGSRPEAGHQRCAGRGGACRCGCLVGFGGIDGGGTAAGSDRRAASRRRAAQGVNARGRLHQADFVVGMGL